MRVLAIGNFTGYQYHPFTEVAQSLNAILQTPEFQLDCSGDHDMLRSENITRYDVVLTYSEYFARMLSDEQMAGLRGFVKSGKGLVAVHSGISYANAEYLKMIGAKFVTHPPYQEFTVRISYPSHPVNRGLSDYIIQDELYMVDFVPEIDKKILMEAEFEGVSHPMAWVRSDGLGRIVYLAPGHTAATFQNPVFRRAIVNSILWAGFQLN